MPLLQRYTNDTDWIGGFLARFLMVGGEPMDFKKRFRTDPVVEKRIESLLRTVFMTDWGSLSVTTAARDVLDGFATEIRADVDTHPVGLAPSLNRLPETANRLSALYEIAAQAANPPPKGRIVLVTADSATCAVNLCRASRDYGLAGVAEMTVETGWQRDLLRAENLIRRASVAGITRTILLRKTRHKAKYLTEILSTLEEMELVEYALAVPNRKGGFAPQKYMHIEAKPDADRAAEIAAQSPGMAISYVNWATGDVCIDSLPAAGKAPPWACVATDPDENSGSGSSNLN
jgi:hypothetical protein